MTGWPWSAGAATGIGSLPGTDPLVACTEVLDSLPDLPHLPELPARGIGADVVGRTAALLVDLPVETVASGWQVASRPGADLRRAASLLEEDLAALEVAAHGWTGPLKVQVLGPISLAAALGQARGESAVSDSGLVGDLAASLAEGAAGHLAAVRTRVPAAGVVLQVDEPSLPAALSGAIPTRSGWGRVAPVDDQLARSALGQVLAAHPDRAARLVHCCDEHFPVGLVVAAGAGAVAFDVERIGEGEWEPLAEAVDAGAALVVGAVPTTGSLTSVQAAGRVRALWSRLGFGPDVMRERTVVSPACGLARSSLEQARRIYRTTREAAARLAEED